MLKLSNIALRRGARLLLSNVNLTAYPQQRFGITGANGCGKTSLFALIKGELDADTGDRQLTDTTVITEVGQEMPSSESAAIDYVVNGDRELRIIEAQIEQAKFRDDGFQLATLHGQLDQIDGFTATARAGRILHGLGFKTSEHKNPVNNFSGGWRMRLNLAQALMSRSDLLLLDEPTNHLDLDALVWLEQWLLSYQGILLIISHDREFLDQVVTHIAHLANQTVTTYSGNYSSAERRRAEHLIAQQQAHDKQQREIAHMQKFVDRFRYKASKARQAQSRLKALEKMQQVAAVHADVSFKFKFADPAEIPNPMLTLENVSAGYRNNTVLEDINYSLYAGARIGLLGANGAGKSTMMKVLANKLKPSQGEYLANTGLNIGYFEQHQLDQLDLSASPIHHINQIAQSDSEQSRRSFLGRFGFGGEMINEPVSFRSGGEKARLVLALLVYQKPNLLLLDEPTNHLDIEMRHSISMALQAFKGSLVVVAHDRHLLRLVTDELWLVDDRHVRKFEGDLDDYVRWLNERQRHSDTTHQVVKPRQTNAASAKSIRQQKAAARERLKPLRQQIKTLEQEMDSLEKTSLSCERQLSDPAIYDGANKIKLQALLLEQGDANQKRENLEAQWLTLSEDLESAIAEAN